MNEMNPRTIGMVTQEINQLTAQAQRLILGHAIEIGRRLTEAKQMLSHGEWGKWLKEEIHYSKSSANNMMRIFDAYGSTQMGLFGPEANSQTFGDLEYSKALALLSVPAEEPSSFHHISSLYPDDTVYIKPDHKRSYSGFMYEKLTITWKFSNLGTQTWRGRKLYLSNHDEIRPRAESNYIEIPETPPKTGVEISVVIELRPFEGRTTCHWIMVDSDDNDCYPGSRMFDIDIDVKFKRKNS